MADRFLVWSSNELIFTYIYAVNLVSFVAVHHNFELYLHSACKISPVIKLMK
jgi:hypothetical protein